jgi:hypothetical protein
MSTLYVDNLVEKTSGNGVHIPGHVIQAVYHSWMYNHTLNTTSWSDIFGSSFTFTPKSDNSILIVTADLSVRVNESGTTAAGFTFRNVVDGASLHTPVQTHEFYMANAQDLYTRMTKVDSYTNTSTTAKTIKVQGAGYTTSSNNRVNFADRFKSTITVMEIGQ